jgi:NADPH-dependent 2,4-dienoyl-CoA reductase/sulfur reductase-like enzyme
MRYVIVGAGNAGIAAAKTLRAHDEKAVIRVYTEIKSLFEPYEREQFSVQERRNNCFDAPFNDLLRKRITFVPQPVTRVYPEQNQILVNGHCRVDYDKLLITTGSTPVRIHAPGNHLSGVYQMQFPEAKSLIESLLLDLKLQNLVIVGRTMLASDIAYKLSQHGVLVTFIVPDQHIGETFLNKAEAQRLEEQLRAVGVSLLLESSVSAFLSDDGKLLRAVELADGRQVLTRVALCCTGEHPTTDFLDASGIHLDETTHAVAVNKTMQTNIPNIFAAGNCARIQSSLTHAWSTAAEQGSMAALNMLGALTVETLKVVGRSRTFVTARVPG